MTALTPRLNLDTVRSALSFTPYREPATQDDAMAREAVARIEAHQYGDDTAMFRRHGCYDGDESHRIALEAIRLFREQLQ